MRQTYLRMVGGSIQRKAAVGRAVVLFSAVILLGIAVGWANAGAQEAKEKDAKAAGDAQAPHPSAEMQRLNFYIGEWDYTEKYEKSEEIPNGGTNTGVYTSTLGPGGNSLVQHFHSQGPVGDFEGLIVMTWDPRAKEYKGYLFGNSFPGCVVQTGQFENDVLVFRSEFSMGAMKMNLRSTAKLVAPGKIEAAEYISVNGAPETLMMKVAGTKR
jgi:hypothetical protein